MNIKPTFLYNDKHEPVLVRFSVEQFNRFYAKLKRLSLTAKKQYSDKKVLK